MRIPKAAFNRHRHYIFECVFIVAICSCNTGASNQKATTITPQPNVLQADEILHNRLQAVLGADNRYAEQTTEAVGTTTLDATNATITEAEIALQKTVDSLEKSNGDANKPLENIIAYFKKILESRRALSDLRMVVSADSDDSATMQHNLSQLHKSMADKEKKIAVLEHQNKITIEDNRLPNTQGLTYAPARSESDADIKQRNKNLTLAYSNLQVKYFVLGKNYLVLKQEHERAMKELETLRKAGNQK